MELYWVNGVFAVATRPRGGDWLRDDLAAAQLRGVRHVGSCRTPAEDSELELQDESEVARSLGLEFSRVPIEDFGTPQLSGFGEVLSRIKRTSVPQAKIAIHYRQALGRSPLVAAAMLVRDGMSPTEAWEAIAKARGRAVPETEEQRAWLTRFANS